MALRPSVGRQAPRAELSADARGLRGATRAVLVLGLFALGLVVMGIRGTLPRESIPASLMIFAGTLLAALWLGIRTHRQAVADRERESQRAMVIVMAAQLGRQDDDTLARIARSGGSAGEAAAMILRGRQHPAPPRPSRPAANPTRP